MPATSKRAEDADNEWIDKLYQCCFQQQQWADILQQLAWQIKADGLELWISDSGTDNSRAHKKPLDLNHRLYRQGELNIFLRADKVRDCKRLQHLLPHLHNAVKMSLALEKSEAIQMATSAIAHRFLQPLALFNPRFSISFFSEPMELCILEQSQLSATADALLIKDPKKNLFLDQWVASICNQAVIEASAVFIELGDDISSKPQQKKTVARLQLEPLQVITDSYFLPKEKSFALVLLDQPGKRLQPCENLLKNRYQLTQREASLAILLCQGFSLDEIAVKNHVQTATLRKQLKSVFLKTHTKRQGELIALLLNGSMTYKA